MTYLEIHDRAGSRWIPAGGYFSIGRSAQNHVVVYGATVSRQHARIAFQGERAILEDLGSTHGTAVNGRYVQDWYALSDGDQIQLGDAFIVYHAERQMARHDTQTPPHGFPVVAQPVASPQAASPIAAPFAPNMVHCPRCGTANLKTNTHCFNCGGTLWRTEQIAPASLQRKESTRSATRYTAPERPSPWITALLILLAILIVLLLSLMIGLTLINSPLAGWLAGGTK
jgi:predicted component of type VI protein secretion system